jgi:hypothetical protein
MINSTSTGSLTEFYVLNAVIPEFHEVRTESSSPETDEDDCTPHYLFLDDEGKYSPYQYVLLVALDFPEVLIGWEVAIV